MWGGNSLYVIEATPRPGYRPRTRTAKVLRVEQEVGYSKCREFETGSFVISHLKPR